MALTNTFGNTIQDYEVHEFLGKGGFASVHKAKCLKTLIEVAIKMIDKTLMRKNGMEKRVREEVSIHSQLKHPSILELYTCFEDENYVYLVLELCHNKDLQSYIRKKGSFLTEVEVSSIMRQVVEGMKYLHSYNILHRDISLSNLLLSKDMQVKISDFGLATRLNRPDEKHMTMCGTPNFISPEVAMRGSHGLETDIWSLGCILFTLLAGRPPFDSGGVQGTLTRVVMGECHPLPAHVSPLARDLVQAMLTKNPHDRITLTKVLEHPFIRLEELSTSKMTNDSGMHTMSSRLKTSYLSNNTSQSPYTPSASQTRRTRSDCSPYLDDLKPDGSRANSASAACLETRANGRASGDCGSGCSNNGRFGCLGRSGTRQQQQGSCESYQNLEKVSERLGELALMPRQFDGYRNEVFRNCRGLCRDRDDYSRCHCIEDRQQCSRNEAFRNCRGFCRDRDDYSRCHCIEDRQQYSRSRCSNSGQSCCEPSDPGGGRTVGSNHVSIGLKPPGVHSLAGSQHGSQRDSPESDHQIKEERDRKEKRKDTTESCKREVLSSTRLQPTRFHSKNAVFSILEGGEVCMELIIRKGPANREIVHKVMRISSDGQRIVLYEPVGRRGAPLGNSPPPLPPQGFQLYGVENLPECHHLKYNHALFFTQVVRSKTPKVTYYGEMAKFMLMESLVDFHARFYNGGEVIISPTNGVTIIIEKETGRRQHLTDPKKCDTLTGTGALMWRECEEGRRHCLILERTLASLPGVNFPVIVGNRSRASRTGKENQHCRALMPSYTASLATTASSERQCFETPGVGTAEKLAEDEVVMRYEDGTTITVVKNRVRYRWPDGREKVSRIDNLPSYMVSKMQQMSPALERFSTTRGEVGQEGKKVFSYR